MACASPTLSPSPARWARWAQHLESTVRHLTQKGLVRRISQSKHRYSEARYTRFGKYANGSKHWTEVEVIMVPTEPGRRVAAALGDARAHTRVPGRAGGRRRFIEPNPAALSAMMKAAVFVGRCDLCKTSVRLDNSELSKDVRLAGGARRNLGRGFNPATGKLYANVHCATPNCEGHLQLKPVSGKFDAAVTCDRRCTGAHKEECVCSCAGKMHGIDHAPVMLGASMGTGV